MEELGEESSHDDLLRVRMEFCSLLQEYGLVRLAGTEEDVIDWLEGIIPNLVYSITKRHQFQTLLREGKVMLRREQEANNRGAKLSHADRKGSVVPYGKKRFRRFNLSQS
jgi:hypothetical protein